MPKLKPDKIEEKDLKEYLGSYSDFSFELSVLKMLRESGVECEHGGHYQDPVTNKSREFDKPGEPVGKSTVQVGRVQDGTISAHDSELYEKWGQCLGSAHDLVDRMYWDGDDEDEKYVSTVIPFVVVPDGKLWMVVYDEDGNMTGDPKLADRCSCFIGKEYEMGGRMAGSQISLSHVEIVTFTGMKNFVGTYLGKKEDILRIFCEEGIIAAFKAKQKVED